MPGQFAISAVDGAASTTWQPASADIEASITVELPSGGAEVTAFYFDWAQAPPVSFRVEFHNGSSSSSGTGYGTSPSPQFYDPNMALVVASQDPVEVSTPFDAASVADVVPYRSNTTLVTLDEAVSVQARYATLWIRGNQGIVGEDKFNSSEVGGEVAEWGIIVDDGRGGTMGQDLSGVVFNKEMGRRRVPGLSEETVAVRGGEALGRRSAVVVRDEARDAMLAKYGRYMKRAAEERRWR